MRIISFLSFVIFLSICCSFRSVAQSSLSVTVSNLRNEKGHVLISLFKEGNGYPDEPENAFRKEKLRISNNKAAIVFSNLPAGEYAIAILHDENDDLKMNKTWLGLPREGYGFSNNVMGTFGPPSYSRAKFRHASGQNTVQSIKTRY